MRNKMLLVVPVIAAVEAVSAQAAVEVNKFDAQVYEATDMTELRQVNPLLEVALTVLQYSYKAHLDEVRAKKNPNLLNDTTYAYFLSVYKVIFDEIAKMKLNIKVNGDSVYYVNRGKNEVIECISGGGQYSKSYKLIEEYNDSNWNYLLLINVLNQVKNSAAAINEELIKDTAKKIEQNNKYAKYTEALERAQSDIIKYFEQLELYKYLDEVRKFSCTRLMDEITTIKDSESRQYSFNNLNIEISKAGCQVTVAMISKADSSDVQQFDFQTWFDWAPQEKRNIERIEWDGLYSLCINPEGIVKFTRGWHLFDRELKFPGLNLKTGYTMRDFCYRVNNKGTAQMLKEYRPVFDELLEKASETMLDYEEKLFLDIYFEKMYHRFCCPNLYTVNKFIHFTCNETTLLWLKELMERTEEQLLQGVPTDTPEEQLRQIRDKREDIILDQIANRINEHKYE